MGNCGCGHCACDDDQAKKISDDKIKELEKDIADLGFKVEETANGEIKISE